MIIWSIIPDKLLLETEPPPIAYQEIQFRGTKVLIESLENEQARIARIISTDPADFLRMDLQPGVVLQRKQEYELNTTAPLAY